MKGEPSRRLGVMCQNGKYLQVLLWRGLLVQEDLAMISSFLNGSRYTPDTERVRLRALKETTVTA